MLASPNYLNLVIDAELVQLTATGLEEGSVSGVLETVSGLVSMAQNGQQIMIVDGVKGYYTDFYDSTANLLTLISDVDFPNGCKTVVFLAGRFIVEKPNTGEFYVSASYDASSWDALEFATAEQTPDYLVAVDTDHGVLILFGLKHIEFWQPSSNVDFPFSPIISATQEYGLAAVFSRAKVANTIVFLASTPQGQVQFRAFQGYSAVTVSNPDIDAIINRFDTVDDAVALSFVSDGHEFYQCTFPTENRTFLYDCTTQMWGERQTGVGLQDRHMGNLAVSFAGMTLMSDATTDNLYRVDAETYTDNGTPIKRELQTRHVLSDGDDIGVDELMLEMETGVGISEGQGSDPEVMLQVSKDNGRTFGPERWVSIGAMGEYVKRVVWRRLGMGRDFVYKFRLTDPVKFVITFASATVRKRRQ